MKEQYVEDLKEGSQVNDIFAVLSKETPRPYNAKPGLWFSFTVSDRTGSIKVKFWGDSDDAANDAFALLHPGDVISISKGQVKFDTYEKGLAVSLNSPDQLGPTVVSDYSDFVDTPIKDIDKLISRFREETDAVTDPDISRLLKSVFDDEFMRAFSSAPAAKVRHHNYPGGLLEHVLSMIALSRTIVKQYDADLDVDLLVAGCALHDIGKVLEYKTTAIIGRTVQGDLLGHIPMGAKLVEDMIDRLEDFPPMLKTKILHMVLSHHGKLEYGSPIRPRFMEAFLLHLIDDCDAQFKYALQEKTRASKTADEEAVRTAGPFDILYLK